MSWGSRSSAWTLVALVAAAFLVLGGTAEAKHGQKAHKHKRHKKHKHKKHRHKKSNLGDVFTVQTVVQASVNSPASATSTCPRKTRAVGGGFLLTPVRLELVGLPYESQKVGQRAWRASAQVLDPGGLEGPINLTVYAYCRSGAPKTRTAAATVLTPAGMQVGPQPTASCSRRFKAVGDGFAASGPPLGFVVTDSLPVGSRSSTARELSTGVGGGTLTSYVYCVKRRRALGTQTAFSSPNVAQANVSSVPATCTGRNKSPQGGGFSQSPVSPSTFLYVYESERVGNDWLVSALSAHGDTTSTLTSTVYCG